jgi:hypothetical protein
MKDDDGNERRAIPQKRVALPGITISKEELKRRREHYLSLTPEEQIEFRQSDEERRSQEGRAREALYEQRKKAVDDMQGGHDVKPLPPIPKAKPVNNRQWADYEHQLENTLVKVEGFIDKVPKRTLRGLVAGLKVPKSPPSKKRPLTVQERIAKKARRKKRAPNKIKIRPFHEFFEWLCYLPVKAEFTAADLKAGMNQGRTLGATKEKVKLEGVARPVDNVHALKKVKNRELPTGRK